MLNGKRGRYRNRFFSGRRGTFPFLLYLFMKPKRHELGMWDALTTGNTLYHGYIEVALSVADIGN
jgi:hypothetical protein